MQEVFRADSPSQAVAHVLVVRGAEAYARDRYHVTASDLALFFGKQKPWQIPLSDGAEFSPKHHRDATAFHLWLKGEYYYS